MAKKDIASHIMTVDRRVKLSIVSGFLLIMIIGVMLSFSPRNKLQSTQANQEVSKYSQTAPEKNYFAYQGKTGKDALTILKELATIEQDRSGLVVGINSRKADTSKREYWSFYTNGQPAQVGPADYQTTDKEFIEWRIQTY